jgi:aryl-alcohol dehydrogenase-like predicted oxidoreductase
MRYGRIEGVPRPVSRIVQGGMMLRPGDGQAAADALLDAALETGIVAFDLAHIYGGGACERAFGDWMRRRANRDRVVILDKGCHPSGALRRVTPACIESDFGDSLGRLGTDRIDIWMFHRDDPAQPVGPLMETLARAVEEGKIGVFGGSNWTVPRIREARAYCREHGLPPFAANSPNYGLAEQIQSPWGPDCVTISGPRHAGDREWHRREGLPVFAWSSLARGFFSGRLSRSNLEQVKGRFEEETIRCYVCEDNLRRLDRVERLAARRGLTVPQVALAFVLNQPFDVYALVGAMNPAEVRENARVADLVLSPAELAWLDLQTDAEPGA